MNWMPDLGAYTNYLYPGEDMGKSKSRTDVRSPRVGRLGGVMVGRPGLLLCPISSIFCGDVASRLSNVFARVFGLLGFWNLRYSPKVDEVF